MNKYIGRVFLSCSWRILKLIFIFSLSFIPLPSTIFTKMFTGCSTCIFRYQWHGSCKLEHRHRMSYAQLCDDRSDMGNLKSVSRLDAFNYIPIYIQCKKSLQKYHSYFLPFKTKTFERVTLFLKSYLFYKLVLIWSHHPHLQIMGRKITENLGFRSPFRNVKFCFVLFLFIFTYLIKKTAYLCF